MRYSLISHNIYNTSFNQIYSCKLQKERDKRNIGDNINGWTAEITCPGFPYLYYLSLVSLLIFSCISLLLLWSTLISFKVMNLDQVLCYLLNS